MQLIILQKFIENAQKNLDNKIKENQAQYDLDRWAAKISAFSSGELRKHEYLAGEDLGYRPVVLKQAKFDYSPLCKVSNMELDNKDDKKEGLLKRLKNIEDKIKGKNKKESEPIKNEEQLEAIKDESTMADKKPKQIVLLKNKLDYIFKNFGSRFYSIGKNFLKKLAKDEKKLIMIICFLK